MLAATVRDPLDGIEHGHLAGTDGSGKAVGGKAYLHT
jgi:hypothetical protein